MIVSQMEMNFAGIIIARRQHSKHYFQINEFHVYNTVIDTLELFHWILKSKLMLTTLWQCSVMRVITLQLSYKIDNPFSLKTRSLFYCDNADVLVEVTWGMLLNYKGEIWESLNITQRREDESAVSNLICGHDCLSFLQNHVRHCRF